MIKTGKVHRFDSNIDTDQIIPSQYLVLPSINEMVEHVMEPIKPNFSQSFSKGDIIVAGRNFGCGSSREQAPAVLKEMGVGCIIAESFARIFYRNCINLGVPVIELKDVSGFSDGDVVKVDFIQGNIINENKKSKYGFLQYSKYVQDLIDSGGLIEYFKKTTAFKGE